MLMFCVVWKAADVWRDGRALDRGAIDLRPAGERMHETNDKIDGIRVEGERAIDKKRRLV